MHILLQVNWEPPPPFSFDGTMPVLLIPLSETFTRKLCYVYSLTIFYIVVSSLTTVPAGHSAPQEGKQVSLPCIVTCLGTHDVS